MPIKMQVKTFLRMNPIDAERILQAWLDNNPLININHLVQSQDGGWIYVTIFYIPIV
jgi:hypothetical protein